LKLLHGPEKVILSGNLSFARFAGGSGESLAKVRPQFPEFLEHGVLADARRSGQNENGSPAFIRREIPDGIGVGLVVLHIAV
jgi:hypothetical protein